MSKMPMIFAGHGSPMNAIEDNRYTREWREMAKKIPRPESIVSISAHWYTEGTKIMNEENPKTVYDMYGFPEELYKISYNAPGNPGLAGNVKDMISKQSVYDNTWGIDHGTWSVLTHMYPQRDIPVFSDQYRCFCPAAGSLPDRKGIKILKGSGRSFIWHRKYCSQFKIAGLGNGRRWIQMGIFV